MEILYLLVYNKFNQKHITKGVFPTMSLPLFNAKSDSFSDICANFIKNFSILPILRQCGARKLRGVPISRIFGFLLSSAFANGSSFYQQNQAEKDDGIPSYRSTTRFMSSDLVNWDKVTLRTAASIIQKELKPIYDHESETIKSYRCLVADDTPFKRNRSKQVENAVKCFDHSSNTYYNGFRDLHLVYTDGLTTMPLSHCLMSERIEGSRERCHLKMTDALIEMIAQAKDEGIDADYVLFDSWFGNPKEIRRCYEMGYNVVCMVKKAKTKFSLEDGRELSVKKIFSSSRKRRGRSRYLLSTIVSLPDSEVKAKLVFVRNRNNRKDWLVILSTNLELNEDEVVAVYTNRWSIETFFKSYKQDLRAVSKCRARKYCEINANCAIALLQYMVLAIYKRIQLDSRTLGELFVSILDEGTQEALLKIMDELCSILISQIAKAFSISEDEVRVTIFETVDAFLASFKISLQRAA